MKLEDVFMINASWEWIFPKYMCREKADLKEIWRSLSRYKEEHGRFPESLEEWICYDVNAEGLLAAPAFSRESKYVVYFSLLNKSDEYLVVPDPGIAWPESDVPPKIEGSAHRLGERPIGLFNTGRIDMYLPIHEQAVDRALDERR